MVFSTEITHDIFSILLEKGILLSFCFMSSSRQSTPFQNNFSIQHSEDEIGRV